MIEAIRRNPVRVYAAVSAALALAANYWPALPVPLILAWVVSILGAGEVVRAKVTPMAQVRIHADDVPPGSTVAVLDEQDYRDYLLDNQYNRRTA